MTEHLKFNELFLQAIQIWPAEISVSRLKYNENGKYSIPELNDLSDEISCSYIGKSDEVIMRNLHDAIFSVLHSAAEFSERIFLKDLRADAVRKTFEIRLKDALLRPQLGWSASDKDLVATYFK